MIFEWSRHARRPVTVWAVVAVWGIALLVLIAFNATWLVSGIIIAFSIPALMDLLRNQKSRLEVWPNRIIWESSLVDGDRRDIAHVRLDRRFDGSMKITLIHLGGAHTRLPPDITPPTKSFESALKSAGIPAERHPFTPF